MKVFGITVALLLALVAAPVAAAQQEPSTIDRIIAQEQAKGLLDTGTSPATLGPLQAQEHGRRLDPRILGSTVAPSRTSVVIVRSGGFDWGDAGIGAAAAFAVALLAVGGVALVRGSRRDDAYGEVQA